MNKGNNKGIIIVMIPEIISKVGARRLPRFRIGFNKKFFLKYFLNVLPYQPYCERNSFKVWL